MALIRCPPGKFFWLDESRGSFLVTFTISTFLPEHLFMLKSWGVGWWVVAHVILVSAQVLLVLTFGLWTSDLGLTMMSSFITHVSPRL